MTDDFRFNVTQDILSLGIRVRCLLIVGLDNLYEDSVFEQYRKEELAKIKATLSEGSIQADPVLSGFREMHKRIGKTGKRWTSSPENLKRMLLESQTLVAINKVVSIYNLVSLKSSLALGAHDLDKIVGNVTLRLTTGTEKFWPIGAKEPEKVSQGEYAYCDDANDVICRMEVRQVEKTKVLPHTKNIFFIVQGNQNTSDEEISHASGELARLITDCAGGRCIAL